MPKRSSKHTTLDQRMVVPTGGLDLSAPANAIPETALARAYNWWYEPERGLCVRQGLAREDVAPFATPILAMHPYVDATGTLRLLAASGGKLWRRNGTAWAEVATLDSATVSPSFATYNGACLMADGRAAGLVKYDGVTVGTIAGSPAQPHSLSEIGGRVVCASKGQPDAVYFSGPKDYTDWSTAAPGGALVIPAGFGDGYEVTGFAVLYDTLIVSKVKRDSSGNVLGRRLYGISTAGEPASWSVRLISENNAALFSGGIRAVGNAVYMVDSNGFKAASPTPNGQYGDIGVDPVVGVKINKLLAQLTRGADAVTLRYVHSLAQLWCIVRLGSEARTVVYHPLQGAFTQVDFGVFKPRAVVEIGGKVYLAGDDGVLYSLYNKGTDTLVAGVETPVAASLRTRTFEGLGGDLTLKRSKMVLDALRPAEVLLEAVDGDGVTRTEIGRVATATGGASTPLYEAYDALVDATYKLGDAAARVEPMFYGGPRGSSLALQVRVFGGRVVLNSLTAEFAVVGR